MGIKKKLRHKVKFLKEKNSTPETQKVNNQTSPPKHSECTRAFNSHTTL